MKHEKMCFNVIQKCVKEESEDMLVELANLFREFLDIVSSNVLNGFTPTRKINHQIDLIPEANF